MIRFVIGRVIASVVVIVVVATASFLLLHAAPGGPFSTDARRSPAVQAAMEERYHLTDGLGDQWLHAMSNLAHGDLGVSMRKDVSVNTLIAEHAPTSAIIGVLGLVTAAVFGVALGVAAAWRKHTWLDYASMIVSIAAISVPAFVLGPLLVAWLSLRWGWLPPAQLAGASSYVLPAVTLGMVYLGVIARLTRGGMIDALAQDFIRTARAKGLRERVVIGKHALKTGIVPVVTYLGPASAAMIAGSFVVEKIFQIPGLGTYFVTSIAERDYPVTTGVFVFYAVLVVAANLVVDIAVGVLDPRSRDA